VCGSIDHLYFYVMHSNKDRFEMKTSKNKSALK